MPGPGTVTDKPWIERGWVVMIYIIISVIVGWLLGVVLGQKAFLPILTAILFYPVYGYRLIRGRLAAAAGWAMFWALCMTVVGIAITVYWPRVFTGAWAGRVDLAVERGGDYTKSMFVWIASGVGAESDPSRFIPVHLRNLGIFSVASLLSGGALGLAFGAVQLNLMNFYVGMFASYSPQPFLALLLAWPPYSIIRVLGYIILATGIAAPLACIMTKRAVPWGKAWRFFGIGVAFAGLDILLKWLMAPLWREVLRGLVPTFVGGNAF